MDLNTATTQPGRPIDAAAQKTVEVRKQLQVAGAELHLTNAALERHLPTGAKQGDVAHALEQRESIEEKVIDAADELTAVRELLDEEVAERERLEHELSEVRRAAASAGKLDVGPASV